VLQLDLDHVLVVAGALRDREGLGQLQPCHAGAHAHRDLLCRQAGVIAAGSGGAGSRYERVTVNLNLRWTVTPMAVTSLVSVVVVPAFG
jgi:hypothetical protein